jgi:hypothetical protein
MVEPSSKTLPRAPEAEIQDESLEDGNGNDNLNKETMRTSDSDGDREFDVDKYPVREWEFVIPGFRDPVAINPVVSAIGVIVLWGLAIWCMGKSTLVSFQRLTMRVLVRRS